LKGGNDYASSTTRSFEDQTACPTSIRSPDLPNPRHFTFEPDYPTTQNSSSDNLIEGGIFGSHAGIMGALPPRQTSRALSQGRIPRPRNSYFLFCSAFHQGKYLTKAVEKDHRHISRITAFFWAQLPETEKDVWRQMAELEKKQHALTYPDYQFKPTPRIKPHTRRNVKRKSAEEIDRCRKIATLLRNGKSGEELTHAVRHMESDQPSTVSEEGTTSSGCEEGKLHLPMYEHPQVSQLTFVPFQQVKADQPPSFRNPLPSLPQVPLKRSYPVSPCNDSVVTV